MKIMKLATLSKLVLLSSMVPASLSPASAQVLPLPGARQQMEPPESSASGDMPPMMPSNTPQLGVFRGSTPAGELSATPVKLSLSAAIERGLRYNLGILIGNTATESARGARWRALSDLLPNVNARAGQSVQQINLAAFGFPRPAGTPAVIGPFSLFDARATLSQRLFDLQATNRLRAADENLKATQYSYQQARETVVLVVADMYLRVLAAQARAASAETQLSTAQDLYQQALHLREAGVAAGIDVLRAQVQMQARQQNLLVTRNALQQQKLALARAIGMPLGQQFDLTDTMPHSSVPPVPLEQALVVALQQRPDYAQAQALVRAAEKSHSAAVAGRFPSVSFDGDYGILGRRPTESHGTFNATMTLHIPIFQGGKVRGEELQADALLRQRRAEREDLRGRIDAEVRTAFMDLESAAQQVEVARSTVQLAEQQLVQARDRFSAGVASSVEISQAQDAVATANENYIASLYLLNVAKARLAQAVGAAEKSIKEFLGGQ